MKSILSLLTPLALMPAALLVFAGCASAPKENQMVVVHFKPGVPGGTYVETYQTSARVAAINPAIREVTFMAPDGSTNTFCAGPKVVNFSRYQVGDAVKMVVVRELAMYLDKDAPLTTSAVANMIPELPDIQPGVWTANTTQLSATVTALNQQKQEVTLKLSDGRTATFKVRQDIDLTKVNVGAEGVIRTSAALALLRNQP